MLPFGHISLAKNSMTSGNFEVWLGKNMLGVYGVSVRILLMNNKKACFQKKPLGTSGW